MTIKDATVRDTLSDVIRTSRQQKLIVILAFTTLGITVAGVVYAALTQSLATFLSSAVGTAAGGMVAIWGAFYTWTKDTERAETAGVVRRSQDAVLEQAKQCLQIATWSRKGSDQEAHAQIEAIHFSLKATTFIISDSAIRSEVREVLRCLTPTFDDQEMHNKQPYYDRAHTCAAWMGEIAEHHLHGEGPNLKRSSKRQELISMMDQYDDEQAEAMRHTEAVVKELQQRLHGPNSL